MSKYIYVPRILLTTNYCISQERTVYFHVCGFRVIRENLKTNREFYCKEETTIYSCVSIYIHFIYLINELNTDLGGWGADFIAYRHAYQPPVLYTAFPFRQKQRRRNNSSYILFGQGGFVISKRYDLFFTASEKFILNRFSTFKVSYQKSINSREYLSFLFLIVCYYNTVEKPQVFM